VGSCRPRQAPCVASEDTPWSRMSDGTDVEAPMFVEAGVKDSSGGAGHRGKRVLVVDDDPQTKPLMVAFLDHLGYRGDAVSSGAEALDALARGDYGVVLLDCMLPGMDGFETAKRIRDLGLPGNQLRILGFSGLDRVDLRMKCMAAGMDGYIPKPFTEAELRAAIERVQ